MTTNRPASALIRSASWPAIRGHVSRRLAGVAGMEHLPPTGGFVVIANHRSYYDHLVMATLLRQFRPGQPVWFVTKAEAFASTASRTWHEAWHSISVDREGPTPTAVKAIRNRLTAGEIVVVYPEGTRNLESSLLEFKDGAFRFAESVGVPVIPAGLTGTDAVLPPGSRRPQRGHVRVAFGEPLRATSLSRRERTQELLEQGRTEVAGLIARAEVANFGALASEATAIAVDRQLGEALDASGRLSEDLVRRYAQLLRIAWNSGTRGSGLAAQRLRVRGLEVMNRDGLLRLATALPLGWQLRTFTRAHREHAFAHYLLGRWQLAVPGSLGGGAYRARRTFRLAARWSPNGDTRALTGLADACRAVGDLGGAQAALQQVIDETDPRLRGAARIVRARAQLDTLMKGAA
ncbi:MAG: lysophospholipid acyltransferase family protein [Nocardioides sp.]